VGGDGGGRDTGAGGGAGATGSDVSAPGAGPLSGFGGEGGGAEGAPSADSPASAGGSSLSLRNRRKSNIDGDHESTCFRPFARGPPHRFSPGPATPVVPTTPSERLRSLGLELPPAPRPVGAYSPVVLEERRAWVSGQIATEGGAPVHPGRVDGDVSLDVARNLARRASLQGVSALAAALGSIDRVRQIVRVTVYVASSPGFVRQHEVANGATEVLVQLFGENGRPSRVAVGVAYLPLNAAVEVDLIAATD
jgi:enamine deaminase RidA (YjgF/YER057c/UK114 family)